MLEVVGGVAVVRVVEEMGRAVSAVVIAKRGAYPPPIPAVVFHLHILYTCILQDNTAFPFHHNYYIIYMYISTRKMFDRDNNKKMFWNTKQFEVSLSDIVYIYSQISR